MLLPPVKDAAKKYGDLPVIVAGGIYTYEVFSAFLPGSGRSANGNQIPGNQRE